MQKKCYKLETTPFGTNWDTASTNCQAKSAKLASIENACEQQTVAALATKDVWIGGSDKATEGTWIWPSGTEFYKNKAPVSGIYTNLATAFENTGQENQDCTQIKTDGKWDDIVCTTFKDYICEKAAYVGGNTYVAPSTAAPTTQKCASSCQAGWKEIDCMCYKYESVAKSWQAAEADCESKQTSAKLVSISSEAIELEMLDLAGKKDFWTGGNDLTTQKTFVWKFDGKTFYENDAPVAGMYNKWWSTTAVSQPNHADGQDCVKFRTKEDSGGNLEKYGWDDVSCDKEFAYICQYSVLN